MRSPAEWHADALAGRQSAWAHTNFAGQQLTGSGERWANAGLNVKSFAGLGALLPVISRIYEAFYYVPVIYCDSSALYAPFHRTLPAQFTRILPVLYLHLERTLPELCESLVVLLY